MAKKPKTIKAIAKRFKTTKSGKVVKRKAGQDHLNAKESGKITRQKRNDLNLASASAKNIMHQENNETVLCGVRYGNVLYSRGSVLPYFIYQMKQNKKLRVTHPDMTRFLLPLPNAVDLVLFALINGENGHMYIRKSPACTVIILAQAICKIFNYKNGYEEVGIRSGEKMHETLVSKEELFRAEDMGEYYKIPPESQGLDYNQYLFHGDRIDAENLCFFADAYALDGLRTASKRFEIDGTRYEAIGNTVRIAGSEQQANATCLARLMTADRLKIEKQVIEVQ